MGLTSFEFGIFILFGVVLYYTVFRGQQWKLLLVLSYLYYAAADVKNVIFLLAVTIITYTAGCILDRDMEKKKRKRIVAVALFLDFLILGVLKYTDFLIDNINRIFHGNISMLELVLPLGLSFFTFQSAGYLLDVYWKKTKAEKNFFRYALFVAWFPQIMQGPIGRFERLAHQFEGTHRFQMENIERGLQLILYGLFKKMILADNAAMFVDHIFHQYETFDGLVLAGVLAYSIQLYGDFSGGIDVVRGVSYLFGIVLDENFRQPYFAVSITDFWHRWHITLGTWMKDYVFYPISLSGWMGKLSKKTKKIFGRKKGRTIPICIANILVFLLVGVWHGAAWKYIAYGLYNGIIIGVSGLLTESYRNWKEKLHIAPESRGFHLFQIIRTFILVNISWLFDMADTVGQALRMLVNLVTKFDWSPLFDGSIYADVPGYITYRYVQFLAIFIGSAVVFFISLQKEKGKDVAAWLMSVPFWKRAALYLGVLFMTAMLGMPVNATGGFIYAQF